MLAQFPEEAWGSGAAAANHTPPCAAACSVCMPVQPIQQLPSGSADHFRQQVRLSDRQLAQSMCACNTPHQKFPPVHCSRQFTQARHPPRKPAGVSPQLRQLTCSASLSCAVYAASLSLHVQHTVCHNVPELLSTISIQPSMQLLHAHA